MNAAVGRNSASSDTREALGGSGGVRVEASTTIYRPAQEVYAYWRMFDNLPTLHEPPPGGRRSRRWPFSMDRQRPARFAGTSWTAEIINDVPPELISWRSVGDGDVVTAGSVRFKPAGGDRTEVSVKLQYDPPAGKVGATVAWALGEDPADPDRRGSAPLQATARNRPDFTGERTIVRPSVAAGPGSGAAHE